MSNPNKPVQRARDVMTRSISYIDGMATAREAADQMRQDGVEALLVRKRHPDDAYGVVSFQDLVTGVIIPNRSPDDVNIFEIMTKPVITVPADMDIRYVVRLLVMARIRRAPVEENGEYIGMISLKALIQDRILF